MNKFRILLLMCLVFGIIISNGLYLKFVKGFSQNKSHSILPNSDYVSIKDFGLVDNSKILKHTFIVADEDVDFNSIKIIKSSCSCLGAELKKAQTGEINLEMSFKINKPAGQEVYTAVKYNPSGDIKKYVLRAFGNDTFNINPAVGYIEAPDGDIIDYPVRISFFTGFNSTVKFKSFRSKVYELSCDQPDVKVVSEGEYKTFVFDINLHYDGGGSLGYVEKIVANPQFVLTSGEKEHVIPMKLYIEKGREACRVVPEKVFMMPSKTNDSLIQKNVKLDFLTEVVPKNITVRSDSSVPYKVTTRKESEKSFMIIVSSDKEKLQDVSLGMHKGELIIVPEGVSELSPIKLPVSMFVRE